MVIIPLTGKISWKNPPIMTVLIIVINCFVFFGLQSKDDEQYAKAMRFYMESGLARMEVTRYVDYLRAKKKPNPDLHPQAEMHDEMLLRFYLRMQRDEAFLARLENNQIITPQDQQYGNWKQLLAQYRSLREGAFSFRYGFIPAHPNIPAAFIHMFTHGGFLHLLGNMIFLWLVGCVLELGCGRIFYAGLYLLTGLAAVGTFFFIYSSSTVPLIGASGAVAGLMGAFTVIYGLRKIRVFYSLGFYFNYTQVPALVLLPLWIAIQFFQLFFGMASNVAYVAHIGGLASGAVVGMLYRKLLGNVDGKVFEPDPQETIAPLLEKALTCMAELDMRGSRKLLEEILAINPDHRPAMTHLFNIDKLHPETETFRKTASRLLQYLMKSNAAQELIYETYREYRSVMKEPRLPVDLLLHLCPRFSGAGHLDDTVELIEYALQKFPNHPGVPAAVLNLARAILKGEQGGRGRRFLERLCELYPGTKEGAMAEGLLKLLK